MCSLPNASKLGFHPGLYEHWPYCLYRCVWLKQMRRNTWYLCESQKISLTPVQFSWASTPRSYHVQPFARLLVKSSSIYAYHVVMSNIIFAYRVFCSIIIGKGTCHMPRGGSFQSRNYDSNPPNPSWRPINNTSMRTKVRWEPLSHYHLNLIIALSWNTYQYEIVMQIILRTLLFQFCGRPCKVSGIAKSLTKIVFLVIICFGSITLYCIVWVTSLPPSDKSEAIINRKKGIQWGLHCIVLLSSH